MKTARLLWPSGFFLFGTEAIKRESEGQLYISEREERKMNDELQDFKQFMKQREEAAHAYVRGEMAPLSRQVACASPAAFFGPQAGYRQGAVELPRPTNAMPRRLDRQEPATLRSYTWPQVTALPTGSVSSARPLIW